MKLALLHTFTSMAEALKANKAKTKDQKKEEKKEEKKEATEEEKKA